MLCDLNQMPAESSRETDVCIAGAGAAGLTLARRLLARGRRVCLLESGGLDYDADTQALARGDNAGMDYYPLEESRLRFFGGTTAIWGGRCALLDSIDLDHRPWVPHSGWPIAYDELLDWYRAAHDELALGAFAYDGDTILHRALTESGANPAQIDGALLQARLWRFDTMHDRFGPRRCRDIVDSPRATIFTNANLVNIEVDADAGRTTAFRVRSLSGKTLTIRARHFILACGGLENARLLLLSDDVERHGVGNRHDQVGRYFMEHPHGRIGRVHTDSAYRLWRSLRKRFPAGGPPLAPALVAAPGQQHRAGILNSAVTLKLQRDPALGPKLSKRAYMHLKKELDPDHRGRMAHRWYRWARDWRSRTVTDLAKRFGARRGALQLHLVIRAEQAPNPSSRVRLGPERDALGCRRIVLDWQLSELDKHSASALADLFDGEFRRLGLGFVEKSPWLQEPGNHWPVDVTVSNHPIGGYHHMGTTRMSSDPRQGVVDRDCRVHGYDNLYIAGSSVFATAGWANPTLTIIALCLRLADTIDRRLSG